MLEIFEKLLSEIRAKKPLIHQITNYVTVNDCANVTLAIGASPAMADDENEVEDFVKIASSLLINIGTLNENMKKSMQKATVKAKKLKKVVVLDPVAVGASKYRTDCVKKLLKNRKISVIRGNISEIKALLGSSKNQNGADASSSDFESIENSIQIAKKLALKEKVIVALTGEIDVISDGKRAVVIESGSKLLQDITGAGCMSTSLVASFCGTNKEYLFEATVLGVLTMALCGEIAENLAAKDGLGSFHKELFNQISRLDIETIKNKGRFYEKSC